MSKSAIPGLWVILAVIWAGGTRAGQEAAGQDWPCWRGPTHDGKSPVTGIRADWSAGLKPLWEKTDLPGGYSAPVVAGDRLVVLGRRQVGWQKGQKEPPKENKDVILCLSAATGEVIWKQEYDVPPMNYAQTNATAAIDGEKVYTLGGGGHLTCWNLADGKQVWRVNLIDETGRKPGYGFAASPLVHGDNVIVFAGGRTSCYWLGEVPDPRLKKREGALEFQVGAFNKADGKIAWRAGFSSDRDNQEYSSPVPATIDGKEQIVVLVPGKVEGKTGTGEVYGKKFTWEAVIAGLDPRTGSTLWAHPFMAAYHFSHTPIVDGSTVFVFNAKGRGGMAIEVKDGQTRELWNSPEIDTTYGSDAVGVGGYLYGFGPTGALKCVELKTGRLMWSAGQDATGFYMGTDRGNVAGIIVADGRLLITSGGGAMLVAPSPEAFNLVTKAKVAAGTSPALAGGRLYVRGGYANSRLACYDLKK